jgi:hypothetical protein
VIKPSHSGFFVIHLVGRGDKTESLGDKPSDSVGRGDFFYSLGGMRWDAARRGETWREKFCTKRRHGPMKGAHGGANGRRGGHEPLGRYGQWRRHGGGDDDAR